jgi:hypothetical protein
MMKIDSGSDTSVSEMLAPWRFVRANWHAGPGLTSAGHDRACLLGPPLAPRSCHICQQILN